MTMTELRKIKTLEDLAYVLEHSPPFGDGEAHRHFRNSMMPYLAHFLRVAEWNKRDSSLGQLDAAAFLLARQADSNYQQAFMGHLHEKPDQSVSYEDAISIAKGCRDYGGGYHDDEVKMKAFHHGIETVIQALISAAGGLDSQAAVLKRLGEAESPGPDEWEGGYA